MALSGLRGAECFHASSTAEKVTETTNSVSQAGDVNCRYCGYFHGTAKVLSREHFASRQVTVSDVSDFCWWHGTASGGTLFAVPFSFSREPSPTQRQSGPDVGTRGAIGGSFVATALLVVLS